MKDLIYLADDDESIRNLVVMFLENEGYQVEAYETGDALLEAYQKKEADLVILDIMMPGTDGLTICHKLREKSNVPIVLLTAKDSDADYVAGITLGSDDYLTKPFHPIILVMRVKALLRRTKQMSAVSTEEAQIQCGNVYFSQKEHSVRCNQHEIEFTMMEFECFAYLVKHFQEAVSRQALLSEVWGYDNLVESRVTDETIRRIRKKLTAAGSSLRIVNKWGYGYLLEEIHEEEI